MPSDCINNPKHWLARAAEMRAIAAFSSKRTQALELGLGDDGFVIDAAGSSS